MQTSVRESGTVPVWGLPSILPQPRLSAGLLLVWRAQEDVLAAGLVTGWEKAAHRDQGAWAVLLLLWGAGASQLCSGWGHFFHLCPSQFALSAPHLHGTFLALHALRSFSLPCRIKSISGSG